MEPHQRMNEKIEVLLEELRRINTSVLEASKKINKLSRLAEDGEDLGELKESLATIQARVGGLEVFVDECRNMAVEKNQHPEDIDIWM